MFKNLGKFFLVKPEALAPEEIAFYKEFNFENFIFFKVHFEKDFREYLEVLKSKLPFLKLLAVDQEGGRVIRIPGDYEAPLEIAQKCEKEGKEILTLWAKKIAQSVKDHCLNLNLSPVVDLDDGKAEDFLRKRTFGKDPRKVTAMAEKFIDIHKEMNIEVCLKHFPGLGGVKIDPHKELPIKENISQEDLYPFKKLSPKVNFIMTTHLLVPSIDSNVSTFSQTLVNKLRKDCDYKGIILTDDIAMGALKDYELPERIIRSFASGHNLIIYTGPKPELITAIFEIKGEIEKSPILKERLKESLTILENIVYRKICLN